MSEYRIKVVEYFHSPTKYIIQKKFLWWWFDKSFYVGATFHNIRQVNVYTDKSKVKDFDDFNTARDAALWLQYSKDSYVIFDEEKYFPVLGYVRKDMNYTCYYEYKLEDAKRAYVKYMNSLKQPPKEDIRKITHLPIQ